jgi:two-component system response regulator AtoC
MVNNNNSFKVFVVEDNEWYNKLLVHSLSLNPDFEVVSFFSGKEFLDHLKEKPNVVTLDFLLPDMDGAELLKRIKDFNEDIEVIIISEQDDIETAIELLKAGAYDYIVKTKDIRNRLLNTVNNISKNTDLKAEIKTLKKEVQKKYDFQNSIIGSSESIKKIFTLIEKAVTNNIAVSITGETGTGKELVAKAIHYNSKRSHKSLVVVNVAAIPADLIESELFGHEKGAFTGAAARRIGKFEEAHEGTLFLDEIGEMDINMQVKLLRALQEKEVVRVGGNNVVKTDCRIIVATNKNLMDEVKNGRFREDLYYRLFGLPIELPPLRDRENDILILAKYFIENFSRENDIPIKTLTNEAQKKLFGYSYPGNVRELKAIVELAVVMSNTNEIEPDNITFGSVENMHEMISGDMTLRDYEHRIINYYLKKYDDNINTVAHKLDISPSTIYRMLKETKIDA